MGKGTVFVAGLWHSGTRIIPELLFNNGYKMGYRSDSWDASDIWARSGAVAKLKEACEKREWVKKSKISDYDEEDVKYMQFAINHHFKEIGMEEGQRVIKLPGFSLFLPLIQKSFPKSKIIYVVRNPLDLALSNIEPLFFKELIEKNEQRFASLFSKKVKYTPTQLRRALLARWTLAVKELKFLENKDNFIVVRYEDLCENLNLCCKGFSVFLKTKIKPKIDIKPRMSKFLEQNFYVKYSFKLLDEGDLQDFGYGSWYKKIQKWSDE